MTSFFFKYQYIFILLFCLPSLGVAGDPWVSAIANDDVRAIGELTAAQDDVNLGDSADRTALMIAAKYGDDKLFTSLINRGADPLAVTKRGGNVLMFAVLGRNANIVNRTIKSGVNVDDSADNGWSALTVAAAKGYTDILSVLLVHSENINVRDIYGWTPLMRAVDNEHTATVELLLKSGQAQINAANETGETALHRAAEAGNGDIIKLLLSSNVDREKRDRRGRSPEDILRERGHTELMTLM